MERVPTLQSQRPPGLHEMYRLYDERLWWTGLIMEGFLEGVAHLIWTLEKMGRVGLAEGRKRTF